MVFQIMFNKLLKFNTEINPEVYQTKMWNQLDIVEQELFDIFKNIKHKKHTLQYFEYAPDLNNSFKKPVDQYRKSQDKASNFFY